MSTELQVQAVRVLADNILAKSYSTEEIVTLVEGLIQIRVKDALANEVKQVGFVESNGSHCFAASLGPATNKVLLEKGCTLLYISTIDLTNTV
jgi:hypothetical protein